MKRLAGLACVALAACSTPRAQLKLELGPRVSDEMECPQDQLQYKELDRLISTTKVEISGCGKTTTWKIVEGRWTKARPG
ncbi:MAG TPA: hypothetical protein VGD87_06160, partial [Archangium sp.]